MTGEEMLAMFAWYAFIALGIVCIYLLSTMFADAATLTIVGSSSGQGSWNMSVQGELIAANVSQAVNCSRWEIIAGGMS